ncbi:MAG TPA: class I SAM-dependent methyltransferase [Candidatus Polarisedimenticolia bacterium]|nr:class I SAM-dependent methyltransferase [Candidatus Polarisedimenticolia bacterium]
MESRLLDMRDCASEPFRATYAEMLRLSLSQQPRWFRPLLLKSARLRSLTGYDHWSRAWEYPWAIQAADLGGRSLRALDVGGGGSPFAPYLAAQGHDSFVVDPSLDEGARLVLDPQKSLYRNARSLAKRAIFRVAGIRTLWGLPGGGARAVRYAPDPADHLRFPDAHFDRVFCLSVIEHIPADLWGGCMREFGRVLKPGGRLIITLDMTTEQANERIYLRLTGSCPLRLLGNPRYDTPLRPDDQERRHPGQGYETLGLVWLKPALA